MLKMILYSLGIVMWSVIELPHIKKDYAIKGAIIYSAIMLLNIILLNVYLMDLPWPSFYDFWSKVLNLLGIKGLNPA